MPRTACPSVATRPLLLVISTALATLAAMPCSVVAQDRLRHVDTLPATPATQTLVRERTSSALMDVETMTSELQEPSDVTENTEEKYREGRIIRDRLATFKVTGDRIELVPSDGHAPLTVLENLALERVKNEIVRVGAPIRWDVTAMVTEYEGSNFVLLQRATIASQAVIER